MQLTEIKLSGFKSFVDPTTIKFPSNIMGVVGPNGCGKSNVIDAVRWVMGESSAKQLRGESMTDVIFSGSSARKPVATATVELIFDNAEGRAGGEYANYSEISVKRQVSRDGTSNYYLNGARCRRKDITDLFLGTGLGPRSYAIIEQGMISQIVEARPEDLRGFLEEAAGISRYKERRRETENRIKHTRENLSRLADLREEVTKQLEKLKHQAKAAEKYRELKERYREDESKLLALRWREVNHQLEKQTKRIKGLSTELEARIAEQRSAEKELENLRQAQQTATEHSSKVQAKLYEVGAEIARLEQAIEHQREIRQRQEAEHKKIEAQMSELQQHLVLDKAQVSQTVNLVAELDPQLTKAQQAEKDHAEALSKLEEDLVQWQGQWDEHQGRKSTAEGQIKLLQQQLSHLDERMHHDASRIDQLKSHGFEAVAQKLQAEKQDCESQLQSSTDEAKALSDLDDKLAEQEAQLVGRIEEKRTALETARAQHASLSSRLDSLRLLNTASSASEEALVWLADVLEQSPTRMSTELEVLDDAWAIPVEQALSGWLDAQFIEDKTLAPQNLSTPWGLSLVGRQSPAPVAGTLGEKVRHAGGLGDVLNQIHCAPNVEEAKRQLASLPAGKSVITADGTWLGHGWTKQPPTTQDKNQGILAREAEIRKIEPKLPAIEQEMSQIETALAQTKEELEAHRTKRAAHAQTMRSTERKCSELMGQLAGVENRLKAASAQQVEQAQELEALTKRQAEDEQAVKNARSELEQAIDSLQGHQKVEAELTQTRDGLQEKRRGSQASLGEWRAKREELALRLQSARSGLESLSQSIDRMDHQVGELQSRYVELSETLAQGDRPIKELETQREGLLGKRLDVEAKMKAARAALDELEATRSGFDQQRQAALSAVEQLREQSSAAQLEQREQQINAESLLRRIKELKGDADELLASLPDDAQTQAFQNQLEELEEKIRKLEPVNLAAIDELAVEAERKEYLDRQNADLVEALETLEKAIEKIDRESRTRFKETFDQINTNISVLFPRLFGGGHAHLEMVGNDWLSAGVAIMARPPGKRVARIHLMSGGEKALTAVAFVFSIFNLNPAPFCLLDEVDAPLDDANVGRFTEMVKEMSDTVQFIVVTHNKVTMEAAHQMLGVTMREPGVSRLVSVDLDKAVAMVAEA